MGGFMSHSVDVELAYSSPGSEERKPVHRFLDPRSPSLDINRTPIMMAEPVHMVLDPRSPSEGIERTPISYQLPQKNRMPFIANASSHIPDKIPPLCFEDEPEGSTSETSEQCLSFVTEMDSCEEEKIDLNLESVKIIPVEKMMETSSEELTEKFAISPILSLTPNDHFLNTPSDETRITANIASGATRIKFPNSCVLNSQVPTFEVSKKASTQPSLIPQAVMKKKSDFQPAVKGLGWKKSVGFGFPVKGNSEGRSPLLNRNGDNLAFCPVQTNAIRNIQPAYKQNPLKLKPRNVDADNVMKTMHNKENVTILWEN